MADERVLGLCPQWGCKGAGPPAGGLGGKVSSPEAGALVRSVKMVMAFS